MGPTVEERRCIREQVKEIGNILAAVEGRLRDELFALNGKVMLENPAMCADPPSQEDVAWSLRTIEEQAKRLLDIASEIGDAI